MDAFTIKDLENLTGIKAHTIRIWEQRYGFLNPQRTQTNIRYYSNSELKTVLNIALLNKYGYKISHIDRMTPVEMKEKILSLTQAQAQQERIVNDLIHCMVDLRMEDFETVLDNYIMAKGVERTITQIIFPFLERIGILWLTNHVNPAQEHLVTNIIRQKLIIGIEGVSSHVSLNKTTLLFLPEGEHHELGLLFMYFLLKSRGVKVYYLGSNVPLKDVEYVVNLKKPDFLYSHLTSVAHNFNFEKFLINAHNRMPDIPIIVSGLLTQTYKKRVPSNISFKRSLSEVMEYVATFS
ncbi:MAG: MerR family transcriptional regulator [Sediminibacterium sp.]|jgi:MerR family transcriptional regulator, light-induced transcriptional regulator|uniref:MerR family transcriptional regulator n=1 Tax=Sediminibacterium sp. TaxID=1917865 RepID=UPI002AB9D83B|nr:MerR family transcriptional regulator [Sediminibacterium sp.]MDZ4072026.1 MerR family transcriptional regulator [Sediminibacterium sp.]